MQADWSPIKSIVGSDCTSIIYGQPPCTTFQQITSLNLPPVRYPYIDYIFVGFQSPYSNSHVAKRRQPAGTKCNFSHVPSSLDGEACSMAARINRSKPRGFEGSIVPIRKGQTQVFSKELPSVNPSTYGVGQEREKCNTTN